MSTDSVGADAVEGLGDGRGPAPADAAGAGSARGLGDGRQPASAPGGESGVTGQRVLRLGIDTSTDVRVGLADDTGVLASRAVTDPRAHAEQLMPLVVATLAAAGRRLDEVTEIVVGVGPGPFTGLRVGVVTAQTLGLVLGVPVRGVCSLDAVAAGASRDSGVRRDDEEVRDEGEVRDEKELPDVESAPASSSRARPGISETTATRGEFLAVSDARRREVYWARYTADGRRVDGPNVSPASELPELPVIGPGAEFACGEASPLDGGILAFAGPRLPEVGLSPLYLRRPDAEVPTTRKSTLLQPRLARLDRS